MMTLIVLIINLSIPLSLNMSKIVQLVSTISYRSRPLYGYISYKSPIFENYLGDFCGSLPFPPEPLIKVFNFCFVEQLLVFLNTSWNPHRPVQQHSTFLHFRPNQILHSKFNFNLTFQMMYALLLCDSDKYTWSFWFSRYSLVWYISTASLQSKSP